jgi:type IV pilus assembly protein PilN
MMIRINLLPVRQVQKREVGRQVLILAAIVVIGGLVGNYLWYDNRESERVRLAAQIVETQRRITELEKVIGEVNNINKRKKEVEDKLKILGDLRKLRSGPVRMLDALATATPKKVWISDFNESSNAVKITGRALSHEDVAEMMRGLSTVVWTPKGMGRVVERKRDATTVRVELYTGEGSIEDFTIAEVSAFFSNIDLKQATSIVDKSAGASERRIDFEISMSANYAI